MQFSTLVINKENEKTIVLFLISAFHIYNQWELKQQYFIPETNFNFSLN